VDLRIDEPLHLAVDDDPFAGRGVIRHAIRQIDTACDGVAARI
jgi:hypothetical protein